MNDRRNSLKSITLAIQPSSSLLYNLVPFIGSPGNEGLAKTLLESGLTYNEHTLARIAMFAALAHDDGQELRQLGETVSLAGCGAPLQISKFLLPDSSFDSDARSVHWNTHLYRPRSFPTDRKREEWVLSRLGTLKSLGVDLNEYIGFNGYKSIADIFATWASADAVTKAAALGIDFSPEKMFSKSINPSGPTPQKKLHALANAGADISHIDDKDYYNYGDSHDNLAHKAVHYQAFETLPTLQKLGTDINHRNDCGYTPLDDAMLHHQRRPDRDAKRTVDTLVMLDAQTAKVAGPHRKWTQRTEKDTVQEGPDTKSR